MFVRQQETGEGLHPTARLCEEPARSTHQASGAAFATGRWFRSGPRCGTGGRGESEFTARSAETCSGETSGRTQVGTYGSERYSHTGNACAQTDNDI